MNPTCLAARLPCAGALALTLALASAGPSACGEAAPDAAGSKRPDVPAEKDAAELSEADVAKAMDGLRERQSKLKTLEAKIESSEYDALAEETTTRKGTLRMKFPNCIRRDFTEPKKSSWILKEQTLYEHLPDLKEAYRMEFARANKGAAALASALSMDLKGLREHFSVRGFRKGGALVLQLVPTERNWAKKIRYVRVEVPDGAAFMSHLTLVMLTGDRVSEAYSGIAVDGKLDDSIFDFVPPPGTKVTERKIE